MRINMERHFDMDWINQKEPLFKEIERKLDERIDTVGIPVTYMDMSTGGQLHLNNATGEKEIQLPKYMLHDASAFERLMVKVHEFGHALDCTENYMDTIEFMKAYHDNPIEVEMAAWEQAFWELEYCGFDEVGKKGWESFVEFGAFYLSTYYNNLYALMKFKWDKDAVSFFKELVQDKAEVKTNEG